MKNLHSMLVIILLIMHFFIVSSFLSKIPIRGKHFKSHYKFKSSRSDNFSKYSKYLSVLTVSFSLAYHSFILNADAIPLLDFSPNKETVQPAAVTDIMKDRYAQLRAGVTGEKVNQLRLGDSLISKLRNLDNELDNLQKDLYKDVDIDWDVIKIYPTILRAYTPLFTAYTDKAFPSNTDIDIALRYALRYEVGGMFSGVQDLEDAIDMKRQRAAQRAFAKISVSYDHYLKAGDLYERDETANCAILEGGQTLPECWEMRMPMTYDKISADSYIAPGIDAPAINDEVVVLNGPDKGRTGSVLWISKGSNLESTNVIIKLYNTVSDGFYRHKEIRLYPYQFLAKTTSPSGVFIDNLIAAYIASAISCSILYPIDTYKTRIQAGKSGFPSQKEGGLFKLWKGVGYFIADANDAVYLAVYGLIKPAMLLLINPSNPTAVFSMLVLAGSLGDAIGSVFRVPSELVYKQIQTEAATTAKEAFSLISKDGNVFRFLIISWLAVLCRDMPFAGLQIALYDIYKSLFSFLDEAGWNVVSQQLLWGALAGGTAAYITTPFDLLTTNVMLDAQKNDSENKLVGSSNINSNQALEANKGLFDGIGELFYSKTKEVLEAGGVFALFNGGIERILFFAPAGMIFFTCYETFFEILSQARNGEAFWQR